MSLPLNESDQDVATCLGEDFWEYVEVSITKGEYTSLYNCRFIYNTNIRAVRAHILE